MRPTFLIFTLCVAALTASAENKSKTPTPELEKMVRAAAEQATRQVLAEHAQREFSTDTGHAYVLKFLQSISKGVVDAMRVCDTGEFKSDASEVMILVVSAEGHIDMLFHELNNPYAQCISQHLHLPKSVPKPPSASFPVQLRVVNGPRKVSGPDEPYATMSLPDKK
jgi:hypothetical protein